MEPPVGESDRGKQRKQKRLKGRHHTDQGLEWRRELSTLDEGREDEHPFHEIPPFKKTRKRSSPACSQSSGKRRNGEETKKRSNPRCNSRE